MKLSSTTTDSAKAKTAAAKRKNVSSSSDDSSSDGSEQVVKCVAKAAIKANNVKAGKTKSDAKSEIYFLQIYNKLQINVFVFVKSQSTVVQ